MEDKTTFKSIELTLQGHDVNPTLSRWVTGMLRNREVLSNVGGTEIEAVVDRGCPQEEVLSLVLWNTVIGSLIRRLNDLGYHTIGYADDLVILIIASCYNKSRGMVQLTYPLGKWRENDINSVH